MNPIASSVKSLAQQHQSAFEHARHDSNRIQAAPRPSEERPTWELVIEEVGARLERLAQMKKDYAITKPGEGGELLAAIDQEIGTLTQLVADMKKRDQLGAHKYGVHLQAFNGRDALVDAYQESLDLTVYLRQELQERQSRAGVERELAEARRQLDAMQKQTAALRSQLDKVTHDYDHAASELKAARYELGTLRAQLAKQSDALAASREIAQRLHRQLGGHAA